MFYNNFKTTVFFYYNDFSMFKGVLGTTVCLKHGKITVKQCPIPYSLKNIIQAA